MDVADRQDTVDMHILEEELTGTLQVVTGTHHAESGTHQVVMVGTMDMQLEKQSYKHLSACSNKLKRDISK